jgi:hypothetical protein
MTLIESCVLEGLTCILGCVILIKYYQNDIKSYENVNLIQSKDNQSKDNQSKDNQSKDNQSKDNQSKDNQSKINIINTEKIKLLYIHEQPKPMIIIKHNY